MAFRWRRSWAAPICWIMFVTGGVLHGGTFNAQPVAMAAMVATQKALTPRTL